MNILEHTAFDGQGYVELSGATGLFRFTGHEVVNGQSSNNVNKSPAKNKTVSHLEVLFQSLILSCCQS
jgi:hypothetical protein